MLHFFIRLSVSLHFFPSSPPTPHPRLPASPPPFFCIDALGPHLGPLEA